MSKDESTQNLKVSKAAGGARVILVASVALVLGLTAGGVSLELYGLGAITGKLKPVESVGNWSPFGPEGYYAATVNYRTGLLRQIAQLELDKGTIPANRSAANDILSAADSIDQQLTATLTAHHLELKALVLPKGNPYVGFDDAFKSLSAVPAGALDVKFKARLSRLISANKNDYALDASRMSDPGLVEIAKSFIALDAAVAKRLNSH